MHALTTAITGAIEWFAEYSNSLGMAILGFAVLTKLFLLPITFFGMGWQEQFQARLKNVAALVKALDVADPEQRDTEILAIYRANGITIANQFKALLPLLVQLPILLAFYRAMTTWDVVEETSFLWIQDLSQPDTLFSLGISLPWMGASFNLLPLLLFAAHSTEIMLFPDKTLSVKSFVLPITFFVLFYPFPASCMLFWVTLNILRIPERFCYRRFRQNNEAYPENYPTDNGT